ncbi:MAG: hypothetical protein Q8N37_01270 [bacterium]|nr:hypothetical protein [bacterium]
MEIKVINKEKFYCGCGVEIGASQTACGACQREYNEIQPCLVGHGLPDFFEAGVNIRF